MPRIPRRQPVPRSLPDPDPDRRGRPGRPQDDQYTCDPTGRPAIGGRRPAMASTGSRGRSTYRTPGPIRSTSRFRSPTRATRSCSSAAWRSTTSSYPPAKARRHSRTTATSSTAGSPAMRPTDSGPNENTWDVFAIVEPPPPPPDAAPRRTHRRRPDALLGRGRQLLQAPDARARRATRRVHAVVRHLPRHRSRPWITCSWRPEPPAATTGPRSRSRAATRTRTSARAPPSSVHNPFLDHYLTPFLVDQGDPDDPEDDFNTRVIPIGTSGDWWAASGEGFDWEIVAVRARRTPGADPIQTRGLDHLRKRSERSSSRGVTLDNLVVSTR